MEGEKRETALGYNAWGVLASYGKDRVENEQWWCKLWAVFVLVGFEQLSDDVAAASTLSYICIEQMDVKTRVSKNCDDFFGV